MAVNPDTTVRKLVSMPRELVKAIDDYRFSHRLPSEAAAIRELIEKGLGLK